jgi:hypothetical protein
MKQLIKRLPLVGPLAINLHRLLCKLLLNRSYPGSKNYFDTHYRKGGTSGAGSYNRLAEFKAEVINEFVARNKLASIIEYGCGDGNQLLIAKYPRYLGFDVSDTALALCRKIFANDASKSFKNMNEYGGEIADLTLSLDVIYHLVEDEVFDEYMRRLFDSATKLVIVYSSNMDDAQVYHVRHRKFTDWVETRRPDWKLIERVPNKYPHKASDPDNTSFADFYVFSKAT